MLKRHIKKAIAELQEMTDEDRINARIEKYSKMGEYSVVGEEEIVNENDKK